MEHNAAVIHTSL